MKSAALAQMVELEICNLEVVGSIPTGGCKCSCGKIAMRYYKYCKYCLAETLATQMKIAGEEAVRSIRERQTATAEWIHRHGHKPLFGKTV